MAKENKVISNEETNVNVYEDYFETVFKETGNNGLSPDDVKKYSKTFTKYLNVMKNIEYHNGLKSLNRVPQVDPSKYFKVKFVFGLIRTIIVALATAACLVGVGIFLISRIAIASNTEAAFIAIAGFLISLIIFAIMIIPVNHLRMLYTQYKNMHSLTIGKIYIFDVNGITFASDKVKSPLKYRYKEDENTYHETPLFVRLDSIGANVLILIDCKSNMQFILPIELSHLLTDAESNIPNSERVVVRYPAEMPSFSYEDIKVVEAASILAKSQNQKALFDAINNLLAKVRFYTKYPFCGEYKGIRDDIAKKGNEFKDLLNKSMFTLLNDRFKDFDNSLGKDDDDDDDIEDFFNNDDDNEDDDI